MTKIFEDYKKFISDCLGIMKDVLERSRSEKEASFDIDTVRFLTGRTKEEEMRLRDQFYESYSLELTRNYERKKRTEVFYRSYLIYLLALFERFREDFRNSWLKQSRENIDLFDRQVRDKLKKSKDSYQKEKYFDVDISNAEEYIKGIRKLNLPLLDIDRNLFGLRVFLDDDNRYKENAYSNFVIAKELRNLLVHRSNILDEKFFDSLSHVLNGTIYKQNSKNRKELFKDKDLHFLNDYTGKGNGDDEVNIRPHYMITLYLDLLIVASIMVEGACKSDEEIENLQDIFGEFVNDLILLINEFSDLIKYEFPRIKHFINQLEKILTKRLAMKSDVFLINQIVLSTNYKKFLEWALYRINKEDTAKAKKEFSKLEKRQNEDIKSRLDLILNMEIKTIALAFIKKDDFALIAAIKAFFEKTGRKDISSIDNWSIIQNRIEYSNLIREFRNLVLRRDKDKLDKLLDELSPTNDDLQKRDEPSIDQ